MAPVPATPMLSAALKDCCRMLSRLTAIVFILSMVLCSCLLPRCCSDLKVVP